MTGPVDRDVLVLGGGLAGLCLGIQLLRRRPGLRVTILEKAQFPVREAAHKVGESTVEIGALYFADVLGLRDLLDRTQLRKFGLRFFYSDDRNDDLGVRPELGLRDYLPVRTWQIDRGRFENSLAEVFRSLGGELLDGVKVGEVEVDRDGHRVGFEQEGPRVLTGTWVVDGSGRASLLKKRLGLARRVRHQANAAWWRVPEPVDVADWSDDAGYRGWTAGPRRLSTVHLHGPSYWLWFIPLASGGTSVGIVGADEQHPFGSMRSAEASDLWLRTHEPQAFERLMGAGAREDFLTYKHYSYGVTRVISPDRWALVGDAGLFLDPFYSPGSDFIAMSNTLVVDAVLADLDGRPDAAERAERWNERMLLLYRAFLAVYQGRYPLMGRPEVMTTKITWDFANYWAIHATLFASGRFDDLAVATTLQEPLLRLLRLNLEVQGLLSRWGAVASDRQAPGLRFDYGAAPGLRELNGSLLTAADDDIIDRIARNLAGLEQRAAGIARQVELRSPGVPRIGIALPPAIEAGRSAGGPVHGTVG
jgi:flavin-dependent dehydrogenase